MLEVTDVLPEPRTGAAWARVVRVPLGAASTGSVFFATDAFRAWTASRLARFSFDRF